MFNPGFQAFANAYLAVAINSLGGGIDAAFKRVALK